MPAQYPSFNDREFDLIKKWVNNTALIAEGGGGGGGGNVVGPSGATDGSIALFDGVTGKLIKSSVLKVDAIGRILEDTVFIGTDAGLSDPASTPGSVKIGYEAGMNHNSSVGTTVAIGRRVFKGATGDSFMVGIGHEAGLTSVASNIICIGERAGALARGLGIIALGNNCMDDGTGGEVIAIGHYAGTGSRLNGDLNNDGSVYIGHNCGAGNEGRKAIFIGTYAGAYNKGSNCVIIGHDHIAAGISNLVDGLFKVVQTDANVTPLIRGNFITGEFEVPGYSRVSTDTLSGAGAVSVTKDTTKLTSSGVAQAITLANGVDGQIKRIIHDVDGGSMVLTPSTKTGWSTATFTNAGDSLTLEYVSTRGWIVIGSYGTVIAP